MKFIALASAFIACGEALLGSYWSVTNVPPTGLTDITFPFTLLDTEHSAGYYFAQQFDFQDAGTGYTGLQPRPDVDGVPVIHAVFSSFIRGTRTTDGNCHDGADDGPGVSCGVDWNGVYGRTYDLEVKSRGNELWVGTVIDTVTGLRIRIGSFTVPLAPGITDVQAGFVEWFYGHNSDCSDLPYQNTLFGIPRTTNKGSVGMVTQMTEYGDCMGLVQYYTVEGASGWESNCGYVGARRTIRQSNETHTRTGGGPPSIGDLKRHPSP